MVMKSVKINSVILKPEIQTMSSYIFQDVSCMYKSLGIYHSLINMKSENKMFT